MGRFSYRLSITLLLTMSYVSFILSSEPTVSNKIAIESYQTEDLIAYQNGSLYNFLRTTPSISIGYTNKLELNGSSEYLIYINGKEALYPGFEMEEILKNISLSQVDRVEVVTAPSSQYDSEGRGGIIQIFTTSQNMSQLSAGLSNLSNQVSNFPKDHATKGPLPVYFADLNYSSDLGSISGMYKFRDEFQDKVYLNEDIEKSYFEEQHSYQTKSHLYQLEGILNLPLNLASDFSIRSRFTHQKNDNSLSCFSYENKDYFEDPKRDQKFMNRSRTNLFVGLDHHYDTDILTLSSGYGFTKGWSDFDVKEHDHFLNQNHPQFIHQLYSDFQYRFDKSRLSAGLKIDLNHNTQESEKEVISTFKYFWSRYTESISALYFQWFGQYAEWELKLGVRGEYSYVNNEYSEYFESYNFEDKYFNILPNISINYNFNASNKLSIQYYRRIDRPRLGGFHHLIYDNYSTTSFIFPNVSPQLTDSYEIGYQSDWKTGSFVGSVFFRRTDEPFLQTPVFTSDYYDYNTIDYENISCINNLGIELQVEQKLVKFWDARLSTLLYKNKLDPYDIPIPFMMSSRMSIYDEGIRDFPWSIKMNNYFDIGSGWKAELSGAYYSEENDRHVTFFPRWIVDCGISKMWDLENYRLALYASGNDIFNSMAQRKRSNISSQHTANKRNYASSQSVMVGLKFIFD